MISNAASISPPRSAPSTAGVPLYGTTSASMPASCFIHSAAKCWVLPTATLPSVNLPGRARASSSSWASVLNREPAVTNSARSKLASRQTGAKSFCTSNGSLRNRLTPTA